jgi:hypothetical protein
VCFAAPWLGYGYALTLGLQIVDVSHRQNDLINCYCLVFKVQDDTELFHALGAKNEVILQLTILIIFDIRFHVEPFAIRIFKEIQLYPSFMLCLEDPI